MTVPVTPRGPAAAVVPLDTPTPAPVPEPTLEDRVAAAVLQVDGVAGLHGGRFGEAATYLPGRRVTGVRAGAEGVDVHVTVLFGTDVRAAAVAVRRAVAALAPGPVQVTVEDVVPRESPRDPAAG